MKRLSIESEKLLKNFIELDAINKDMPITYRCFSITHDDINKLRNDNGVIRVDYDIGSTSTKGSIDIGSLDIYMKLMKENIKLFEMIDAGLIVQHLSPHFIEFKKTKSFIDTTNRFDFMNKLSTAGYIYCYFLTEKGRNYFKNKKKQKRKMVIWDYVVPLTISIATLAISLLSLLRIFNKI